MTLSPSPTSVPPPSSAADDALRIWLAGVAAVDSQRLVEQFLRLRHDQLCIGEWSVSLSSFQRLAVVGAGKAGSAMAAGVEAALGQELPRSKHAVGWINVPDDCLRPLNWIHLHAARPAGVNEPTERGEQGSQRILDLVGQTKSEDVCLCLLSGGGSALLPAPADGVTFEDKLAVTRFLSAAGANIRELNAVRKALSRIKGGGLARACRARLFTLVLSDVIGDPLDVIASGPTVSETTDPAEAAGVLRRFGAEAQAFGPRLLAYLDNAPRPSPPTRQARQAIIGNNATAVAAASSRASELGYEAMVRPADGLEGDAESVGRALAEALQSMRRHRRTCLVWGGEPTVKLAPSSVRGQGGRNQQLILAAIDRWRSLQAGELASSDEGDWAMLSGGTDGEDGPTDAAGAWFDRRLLEQAQSEAWTARDFLRRNDAYRFFEAHGGLLRTGPTHTNVCDVRVLIHRPSGDAGWRSARERAS